MKPDIPITKKTTAAILNIDVIPTESISCLYKIVPNPLPTKTLKDTNDIMVPRNFGIVVWAVATNIE